MHSNRHCGAIGKCIGMRCARRQAQPSDLCAASGVLILVGIVSCSKAMAHSRDGLRPMVHQLVPAHHHHMLSQISLPKPTSACAGQQAHRQATHIRITHARMQSCGHAVQQCRMTSTIFINMRAEVLRQYSQRLCMCRSSARKAGTAPFELRQRGQQQPHQPSSSLPAAEVVHTSKKDNRPCIRSSPSTLSSR